MRHTRLSPCQEIKYGVLESWVLRGPSGAFSRIQYALVLRLFFFNATDRTPHFVNRHANEDSTRLACHAVAREFRGGGGIRSHRSDAEALRRFAQRIFLFSDRSGDGSYMARKCAAKDDGETHTPVLTHAVHACEHGAEVPCGSDTDRFHLPPLAALPIVVGAPHG